MVRFLHLALRLRFFRRNFFRRPELDVQALADRRILMQGRLILRAVDPQLVQEPPHRSAGRLHFADRSAHFNPDRHRADDINLRIVLHTKCRHPVLVIVSHGDAGLGDDLVRR